jgi:methylmalonyl-CoA/ethylmalonyl-CoA epimerase
MLKRIDHIGVLVDDLDEARRFLGGTLGLPETRTVDATPIKRRGVFFKCGDAEIEVIEDLDPAVRQQKLGGRKAVIEHIAIQVDDLPETHRALAGLGIRADATGQVQIGPRLHFWTDPDTTDGVVYQFLAEAPNKP